MYSWEIDQLMRLRNYLLDVKEYFHICDTSSQITRIKYDPYEDTFYIETNDSYNWKFKLRKKEFK